jgi:ACR3 family arsenite efflux pump ArsB
MIVDSRKRRTKHKLLFLTKYLSQYFVIYPLLAMTEVKRFLFPRKQYIICIVLVRLIK